MRPDLQISSDSTSVSTSVQGGNIFPLLLGIAMCLALWGGSLAVRRAVLAQQTRSLQGQEAPFILEAALQYRMTRIVYETGRLPTHEPRVQWPEGVYPWKTYSIGAEFIYAPLARLLPADWTLVNRLRWVSTGLFALSVPLAALWSGLLWQSKFAGVLTGLILMVSPAFVVRSSGLALSRENLAIPFLTLFLLSELLSSQASDVRKRWLWVWVAALSAGLSQIFWDFSQYLLGLWALHHWIQRLRNEPSAGAERPLICSVTAGLAAASLLHPYLRHQGFLFSPVMMLFLTRCLVELPALRKHGFRTLLPIALLTSLGWTLLGRLFVENYSHFGELFTAKIRFGNVKPDDPSKLTYLQRIMWTPALNSSTWELTKAYLPFMIYLLLLPIGDLFWARKCPVRGKQVILFTAVTLPMYVLFFRMHVYLILFSSAAVAGWVSYQIHRIRRKAPRVALLLLFPLILTTAETHRLLFFEPPRPASRDSQRDDQLRMLEHMGMVTRATGNRWGHPGQSYPHIESLTAFLRSLEEPDAPVLAGFGISGSILADTGMPILLHPKFESPGIRERVREFYEHLFLKTEAEFRDWASSHGARFYVHGMGSLAGGDTREAPRYMVDALHPPPFAAARVLEERPLQARWFQHVGGNERYRVFRIITNEDAEFAATLTALAFDAASRGDHETARRQAWRALQQYDWKHEPARELIEILGPPRP